MEHQSFRVGTKTLTALHCDERLARQWVIFQINDHCCRQQTPS
jgi:hypothetical protein